jgi:hypothetical protein
MLPCNGSTSRRTSTQCRQSSDNEQPSPGPRQSHVQTAAVGEKAEGTGSIVPHCGKQHDFLLPAFEPVHGLDFDLGELLGSVAQSVTETVSVIRVDVKQIIQQRNLRYVWGYDANVFAAEVLVVVIRTLFGRLKVKVHLILPQQIFKDGAHNSCVGHIDPAAILGCLETIMIQEHD